jgi:hypothetical protein
MKEIHVPARPSHVMPRARTATARERTLKSSIALASNKLQTEDPSVTFPRLLYDLVYIENLSVEICSSETETESYMGFMI